MLPRYPKRPRQGSRRHTLRKTFDLALFSI
jgi:hypothetical protein